MGVGLVRFLQPPDILLISWLQSPSAVVLQPESPLFPHFPLPLHEVTEPGAGARRLYCLTSRQRIKNLDSILKRRDIALSTKVHIGKAMVFPVVMYGCESWTIKKAEH